MKAVILAGGEGTRLRPLTCNMPKPMMPIMERPVMEYIIDLLKKYEIRDIAITLQYLPEEITNYFGDGKDYGVNINYFTEEFPLGTAGCVKNAENFLDDTFVVISGDAVTDINLSQAISFHKGKKAIATIVLKEVKVPLEYGVVIMEKNQRIKGFLEKPSWSEVFSDKVNTGIYVLEPDIFKYFKKNQKFDFSNDLFPILLSKDIPMYGYVTDGYWCDIGSVEQYKNCHYDILNGSVKINIKGKEIKKGLWIGDNCDIAPKCNIEVPAFIGSNTKIQEGCIIGSYCVLGKNNIISSGASLKRSVLLDYCYVGAKAEVKGAVMCSKVQLECRSLVLEHSIIGENTLVGEKALIKPGVRIWPNKEIENCTIVKNNLVWGGKSYKTIFGKNGISGEINVDITPEFVSKLGSAYGSLLKPGSRVAISCSDNGAAQMFKYSLAAGLLSMGIELYDLERMTTNMMRNVTLFLGVQGSIHVIVDRESHHKVNIIFMDQNGLDIDKGIKRKIESRFVREEFRRIQGRDFKKIECFNDCRQYYSRQLINKLGVSNIRSKKYKAVLSIGNELLLSVVQEILGELRISVQHYDEYDNVIGLSNEVLISSADIGISITDQGESAVLIDEKGNIVSDSVYEALNALVMLRTTELTTIVAPVTASMAAEEITRKCGAKFIRTKSSQKQILDTYIKNENSLSRREIVDYYLMSIDAISICMLVLDFMAKNNKQLSSIVSEFPAYFRKYEEISCPWDLKGKVMRRLIEENEFKNSDLIEGVKLNFEEGWVLVLPDLDEPLCKVYSECRKIEDAERLNYNMIKKIKCISSDIIEE